MENQILHNVYHNSVCNGQWLTLKQILLSFLMIDGYLYRTYKMTMIVSHKGIFVTWHKETEIEWVTVLQDQEL